VLVLRAKLGVPAFAGEPPPKEPRVGRGPVSSTVERQRSKYAAWWMANFTPWDRDAPPDMSYKAWQAYRENLQRATFLTLEESAAQKAERYIAHSRLFLIENVSEGFAVHEPTALMLSCHRMRSRTLWSDTNPAPKGPPGSRSDTDLAKECAKLLQELHDKAEKDRKKASKQDLLKSSLKAAE